MKYLFLSLLLFMSAMSVVAWVWQPRQADDRIELIWCSDDNPVRREQIDLFNELHGPGFRPDHPGYRLRLDPQNQGLEKVIVQSLAGVGPDLFDCYSGFELSAYVRSGIAYDATDELNARGVWPESAWPCLAPLFVHEGRMYGFPGNANAHAVWYNRRLFDRHGVPYPEPDWTWEDFIGIAERLTVRNRQGQPVQFGFIGYWDWMSVLYQYGARVYTPEGTRSALDTPEAAAAIQFMQDLIHRHGVSPTPEEEVSMASAGGWATGTIALFGAEKGAMAVAGRWWLCILRDEDFSHLALGAAPLPAGPTPVIPGGGRSTLVNARGENIDGALLFLEYMHGEHWNNLINRQADALAPVTAYNYSDDFLFNPDYPEEDYNHVWREALEAAVPQEVSPYVNGKTVDRILWTQMDLVRAGLKTGEEAGKEAARLINRAIVGQLRNDPEARERYYAAVAAGARPAWDRDEDAP